MKKSESSTPGALVLVRHGQSEWNAKNLFTGWTDVDLTEKGREEARLAGRTLAEADVRFHVAFTSVLVRAIRTLWLVLDEMQLQWIPVERHWRLNERHYGALQGLDKSQTAAQHGAEQVHIWRRSYDTPPPPLDADDERHARHDPRYANIAASALPDTESLKTTLERVRPYWEDHIHPEIARGRNVLVAAHGNSLRAVLKMLESVPDEEIPGINIPTGAPRIYEFDTAMRVTRAEYLGDAEAIESAARAVAEQAEV